MPFLKAYMKFEVEKIESFTGHRDSVYAIAPGSKPTSFYSAAGDGMVVEWDYLKSDLGTPIVKVEHSIYALTKDLDTGYLYIGDNFEGIQVVDPIHKVKINSVALAKTAIFDLKIYKGFLIVASGDGVISILQKDTLNFVKHIKASDKSVRALAVNPIERTLAAGYSDNKIRVFDLVNFQLIHTYEAHDNSVFALAYTSNFETLISGSRDAKLKLWNQGYQLIKEVNAHMYTIHHAELSPNGKLLATGSMDKAIKVWDVENLTLLKVIDKGRNAGHGHSINRLMWLDDEKLVTASDDKTLNLWNIKRKV